MHLRFGSKTFLMAIGELHKLLLLLLLLLHLLLLLLLHLGSKTLLMVIGALAVDERRKGSGAAWRAFGSRVNY